MPLVLGRLARALPLVVALVVLAVLVYALVSWRTSPNRAKIVLIRLFLVLSGALCIFFLGAAGYAAIDSNPIAVELAFTFLVPPAIALVIVLVCRAVFYHNHPSYKVSPVKAEYIDQPRWQRILAWILGRY